MLFFLIIAVGLSSIDLDQAKDTLIAKVSAESGMKIEIESIGFGFSQGLKIKCRGVKVATPDGETYAVAQLNLLPKWVRVPVQIPPMLRPLEGVPLQLEGEVCHGDTPPKLQYVEK